MFIPLDAVVNFIADENLGPYKIAKSDPEAWRIQINEPPSWGTNDRKWRCGIGVKQVDDKKIVVFNGFKAAALYGSDYHGEFFKFVKMVMHLNSVKEAKQWFIGRYMVGVDIKEMLGNSKPRCLFVSERAEVSDINIPDTFEKFNAKVHTEYADYLRARKVPEDRIKKTVLFVNKEENRIIFPVYEDGNLIFYAGRDIKNKSPLLWKKSRGENVFPIWNLDNLSTTCAVFEACFDAIQRPNGVAMFGVGTEEQFKKILAKKLNKVILVFDNDDAGRNARWKWAEWLTEHNQPGVYVFDYKGLNEKDFGTLAEKGIKFDFKERIHFWDYKAKLLWKLKKII